MTSPAIFNAAIAIAELVNNILKLVNSGSDDAVIQQHFSSISDLCAAAKPEIQGYSEHE
jgi:hypothetical protein